VSEPFLDIGNVGLMRERVRCGRRPQRMHTQSIQFKASVARTCSSRSAVPDPLFREARIFKTRRPRTLAKRIGPRNIFLDMYPLVPYNSLGSFFGQWAGVRGSGVGSRQSGFARKSRQTVDGRR
jgi:hypothetical protein